MREVAVIGAGGHARPVLTLLGRLGLKADGIYDEAFRGDGEFILGVPVRGPLVCVPPGYSLVLACGDNHARSVLAERFMSQLLLDPLVHPTAVIEPGVQLGAFCQVLGMAAINACAVIGAGTLVNTGAVIEHEATVGAFCHVSVNATICGRVRIGDFCFLGAGAVVKDKVRICRDTIIGANATVVKDILEPGVYVGSPARRLR